LRLDVESNPYHHGVRKKWSTVWVPLVVLAALTTGAAWLSLATSSPNDGAKGNLEQAVVATLNSNSYTIELTDTFSLDGSDGPITTISLVYGSPDRCESRSSETNGATTTTRLITIGTTSYSETNGSQKWSVNRASATCRTLFQRAQWITAESKAIDVEFTAGVYHWRTQPEMTTTGITRSSGKTVVENGRLSAVEMVTTSALGQGSADSNDLRVTYNSFGSSPSVVSPPASDIAGSTG
jgi:hypothetical protein